MTQNEPPSHPHIKPIFPPWRFNDWVAVDDRVRGGSSRSHLEPLPAKLPHSVSCRRSKGTEAARFWGTLDTQTLGGAGFASQRFVFGPTALHLPRHRYLGLALTYLIDPGRTLRPADPTVFTVVLDTNLPSTPPVQSSSGPDASDEKRQPRPSRLTYEAQFDIASLPSSSSGSKHVDTVDVLLKWTDFHPFYRGRPVPRDDPRWAPLRPEQVFELSLMCRSNFAKQEGEFELVILDLGGWVRAQKPSISVGPVSWALSIVLGVWGWITALLGRGGHVRLEEEEDEKGDMV